MFKLQFGTKNKTKQTPYGHRRLRECCAIGTHRRKGRSPGKAIRRNQRGDGEFLIILDIVFGSNRSPAAI